MFKYVLDTKANQYSYNRTDGNKGPNVPPGVSACSNLPIDSRSINDMAIRCDTAGVFREDAT